MELIKTIVPTWKRWEKGYGMKNSINLVSVTNYFNDIGKERLRSALEAGDKVSICVDCIGHTRAEMVESEYAYWLHDVFGDSLVVFEHTLWGNAYQLKGGKNDD